MATFMLSKTLRLQKSELFSRLGCLHHLYRYQSSSAQESASSEIDNTPDNSLYPAIKPAYPPGEWGDISRTYCWHIYRQAEESLSHNTAKERLEKLAGEKDHKICRVKPFDNQPRTLGFKQYVTNTHRNKRTLPDQVYTNEVSSETLTAVKDMIAETVLEEEEYLVKYKLMKPNLVFKDRQSELDHDFIGLVLRRMVALLSPLASHLTMCQIDESVRCEAFWQRYGFDREDVRFDSYQKWQGMTRFQMQGMLNWQIRHELPLPNFIDPEDEVCKTGFVPEEVVAPYLGGAYTMLGRATNFAGYRIGDPCEFPALTVLCRDPTKSHKARKWQSRAGEQVSTEEDERDIAAALTVGFGTTVATAHNMGFNYMLDMTYPICNQLIMTEGNKLRLGMYQLNTMRMWTQTEVPTKNMFWISQLMTLYEKIEDGKVLGLNDELITYLCQMLLLQPVDDGKVLRPHLPNDDRTRPGASYPYINKAGEPPLDIPKLGRFEVPRNTIYSY